LSFHQLSTEVLNNLDSAWDLSQYNYNNVFASLLQAVSLSFVALHLCILVQQWNCQGCSQM